MDTSDERHRNERNDIETMVIRKREFFETESSTLEETVKEVGGWGDLYAYRIVIDKINEYQK